MSQQRVEDPRRIDEGVSIGELPGHRRIPKSRTCIAGFSNNHERPRIMVEVRVTPLQADVLETPVRSAAEEHEPRGFPAPPTCPPPSSQLLPASSPAPPPVSLSPPSAVPTVVIPWVPPLSAEGVVVANHSVRTMPSGSDPSAKVVQRGLTFGSAQCKANLAQHASASNGLCGRSADLDGASALLDWEDALRGCLVSQKHRRKSETWTPPRMQRQWEPASGQWSRGPSSRLTSAPTAESKTEVRARLQADAARLAERLAAKTNATPAAVVKAAKSELPALAPQSTPSSMQHTDASKEIMRSTGTEPPVSYSSPTVPVSATVEQPSSACQQHGRRTGEVAAAVQRVAAARAALAAVSPIVAGADGMTDPKPLRQQAVKLEADMEAAVARKDYVEAGTRQEELSAVTNKLRHAERQQEAARRRAELAAALQREEAALAAARQMEAESLQRRAAAAAETQQQIQANGEPEAAPEVLVSFTPSAVERVGAQVAQCQAETWQGYLRYVVGQLSRANVVAADVWLEKPGADAEVLLRRPPGGWYIDPSFVPPAGSEQDLARLADEPPPNAAGMGLAGSHWANSVPLASTPDHSGYAGRAFSSLVAGLSGHAGNAFAGLTSPKLRSPRVSKETLPNSPKMRSPRVSKETFAGYAPAVGHERRAERPTVLQWKWLEYLLANPEMLFDEHARHAARVFKWVACFNFSGGVLLLFAGPSASASALSHACSDALTRTLAVTAAAHVTTLPFRLPLDSLLAAFSEGAERPCAYGCFWAVVGGNFQVVAHHVTEARRLQLREQRGDDRTFASESYGFSEALETHGVSPVATAHRTGQKSTLLNAASAASHVFRRAALAMQFGIDVIHFIPAAGGVLEFGDARAVLAPPPAAPVALTSVLRARRPSMEQASALQREITPETAELPTNGHPGAVQKPQTPRGRRPSAGWLGLLPLERDGWGNGHQVPCGQEHNEEWEYLDESGNQQGPFPLTQLRDWFNDGLLPEHLSVRPAGNGGAYTALGPMVRAWTEHRYWGVHAGVYEAQSRFLVAEAGAAAALEATADAEAAGGGDKGTPRTAAAQMEAVRGLLQANRSKVREALGGDSMAHLFSLADEADGYADGYVSYEEVQKVLVELVAVCGGSPGLSSDALGELIRLIDADGDGSINLVEFADAFGLAEPGRAGKGGASRRGRPEILKGLAACLAMSLFALAVALLAITTDLVSFPVPRLVLWLIVVGAGVLTLGVALPLLVACSRSRMGSYLRSSLGKIRGAKGAKAPPRPKLLARATWLNGAVTFAGVFLTLLALSGAHHLLGDLSDGRLFVLVGSWGALLTLLFSAPASPLVQPRNIAGGNLVSFASALLWHVLSESHVPKWLAVVLAPATAISGMQLLGVSHPPAGAVSLIFITGGPRITDPGWMFLAAPLALGNVVAVLLASLINNLSPKRQYPMFW